MPRSGPRLRPAPPPASDGAEMTPPPRWRGPASPPAPPASDRPDPRRSAHREARHEGGPAEDWQFAPAAFPTRGRRAGAGGVNRRSARRTWAGRPGAVCDPMEWSWKDYNDGFNT